MKVYIKTPKVGEHGNELTFGWEDNTIAVGSTTSIPFSNTEPGNYTIQFNTFNYEASPFAKLLLNGKEMELHMDDIVLDDILCLSTGSQVCADAMVVEGRLEVNESLVTGESDIIVKHMHDTLYSGSFVVSGQAKVQVQHVGKDNYAATINEGCKNI